jgi:hypothetical protein
MGLHKSVTECRPVVTVKMCINCLKHQICLKNMSRFRPYVSHTNCPRSCAYEVNQELQFFWPSDANYTSYFEKKKHSDEKNMPHAPWRGPNLGLVNTYRTYNCDPLTWRQIKYASRRFPFKDTFLFWCVLLDDLVTHTHTHNFQQT